MRQALLQSAFSCRQTFFNPTLSLCAASASQFLGNLMSPSLIRSMTGLLFPIGWWGDFHYSGLARVVCGRSFTWFIPALKNIRRAETHMSESLFKTNITFMAPTQSDLDLRFHLRWPEQTDGYGRWQIKQYLTDVVTGVPQSWIVPLFKGQPLCLLLNIKTWNGFDYVLTCLAQSCLRLLPRAPPAGEDAPHPK